MVASAGGSSGGGRSAGAEEDRQAAPGWLRLAAHWDGLLPYERGTDLKLNHIREFSGLVLSTT